jgi:hypothetical protein
MSEGSGSKLIVNPMVMTQRMPGGAVLMNTETGDCFELNRVGADIWERVSRGDLVDTIVDSLAREYSIGRSVLSADVSTLIDDLARRGILVVSR